MLRYSSINNSLATDSTVPACRIQLLGNTYRVQAQRCPSLCRMEMQVEVKKRETDRQIQMRTRSYTHWREQLAAEEPCSLKAHGLTSGKITLTGAAKTVVQQYAAQVAMGVPRKEYLKYLSPAVYLQKRQRCFPPSCTTKSDCQLLACVSRCLFPELSLAVSNLHCGTKPLWCGATDCVLRRKPPAAAVGPAGTAGPAAAKDAAAEEPPPLDGELISALKQALEDLFADQAVVTMRDVRLWLQSYTANVKARMAALQSDSTLSNLLLGGGSVVEIRYIVLCSNVLLPLFRCPGVTCK
jgi:hypothetical protein